MVDSCIVRSVAFSILLLLGACAGDDLAEDPRTEESSSGSGGGEVSISGQAFPEAAWLTDPLGWAAALWGAFLYWWAGIRYLRQAARMIKLPLSEEGG